jgi:hypothetical protein
MSDPEKHRGIFLRDVEVDVEKAGAQTLRVSNRMGRFQ